MPLMPDWATSLTQALDTAEPMLSRAVGLTPDMAGDAFELQLGQFLELASKIPLLKQFKNIGGDTPTSGTAGFQGWVRLAESRCALALETIRENLYVNYNINRLGRARVVKAYTKLLQWFNTEGPVNPPPHLSFATTNYDLAIELAFQSYAPVIDGFVQDNPYSTPQFDPVSITQALADETPAIPVLHLHGAVGWYRTDEGFIRKYPGDMGYNPTLGSPALLLPDATKTTSSLVGAEGLWDVFRRLLLEASHIFVLGHSLHDAHLVDVLNEARAPIAVAWWAPQKAFKSTSAIREGAEYVNSHISRARIVPCEFGPNAVIHQEAMSEFLQAGDYWNEGRD
jgi:hypothetical protein